MKKISFLMLLALAFLLSCRTDQFPEKETYNNTSAFQLTSKRISLNESKHKAKLLPEIEKAEAEFKAKTKSSAFGKTVNYGNGVSIDTDDVIYIENGPNYYTYTFRINRENAPADAPIENLVLSPLSDGTYREMLVTYNLTSQEKNTILSGGGVDLSGKIGYIPLQSGTYSTGLMQKTNDNCYWVVDYTFTTCSEGVHNHGEMADENGGTCQAEVQSVIVVNSAEYVCPNPGGSDLGTIYNPGNTTYPGNNTNPSTEPGATTAGSTTDPTGTSSPCGEGGISTQPQDPSSTLGNQPCNNGIPTLPNLSAEHFKFNQIISQLSPALQSWINQPYNAEVYTYFINYFTYNNQSLEAGNFVKWSFNFLHQNQNVTLAEFQNWFIKADGSSKITINTTSNSNALTFNNMVEFKNYITSFKNSFTPDASSFESINNTNITKFKAKFDILAPVYLNIHAKSTLENPSTYATEFDLLEVNSFKSGISAFLTWNQDSYGHSVDGHVVEINLNGHFDIGVKIGDLDFTYADSYIIKAKYNNITGNAMSISGTPD